MKTKSFKDLIVWQKSYALALEIYSLTKQFPKDEIYGLSSQIRRSSVSIPSNIAEGYARQHKKEYNRFLTIAFGSLNELETQYLLAVDLKYINFHEEIEKLIDEMGRMLYRMIYPIPKDIDAKR